jgi:hypothetical protein
METSTQDITPEIMGQVAEFIKGFICSTEACTVLIQILKPIKDATSDNDLDKKYDIDRLNQIYEDYGHAGVLLALGGSSSPHINLKTYCLSYGDFSKQNILSYTLMLDDREVEMLLRCFANVNKLPLSHGIHYLNGPQLVLYIKAFTY